jgi:plasmid stabilization system protein ParE
VKAVFLEEAEQDLRDLRRYIVKSFGTLVWQDSYDKIKNAVRALRTFPQSGSIPPELEDLSLHQYRQVIAGMNRIIYEAREDTLYIHIVCDTRRDMRTLLSRRLVRVVG